MKKYYLSDSDFLRIVTQEAVIDASAVWDMPLAKLRDKWHNKYHNNVDLGYYTLTMNPTNWVWVSVTDESFAILIVLEYGIRLMQTAAAG